MLSSTIHISMFLDEWIWITPMHHIAPLAREREPVDEELWSLKVVLAKTGLSGSTLYTYIAAGSFPTQRRLGKRRLAWFASQVKAWIASRPAGGIGSLTRGAGCYPAVAAKGMARSPL